MGRSRKDPLTIRWTPKTRFPRKGTRLGNSVNVNVMFNNRQDTWMDSLGVREGSYPVD